MAQTKPRPNKSNRIIGNLKSMANLQVKVENPFAAELEKAAKHIEWLELLVTGITGRERGTIGKLTRRVKTLERMVEARDAKVREHKDVLSVIKRECKLEMQRQEKRHKRELKAAERVSQEQCHEIEKQFIKDLQTGFEKGNALSQARWEGSARGTASGRWYHNTPSGTSNQSY